MSVRALTALVALCAVLAFAQAAAGRGEAGIELSDGSGRAMLQLRGAVLGTVARGRVSVKVLGSAPTQVVLEGCRTKRTLVDATVVCTGENIRFRVFRGSWRVAIDGGGINASAVGRGVVGLRGTGSYALAGGAPEAWPSLYRTIRLGAERPAGGGGR